MEQKIILPTFAVYHFGGIKVDVHTDGNGKVWLKHNHPYLGNYYRELINPSQEQIDSAVLDMVNGTRNAKPLDIKDIISFFDDVEGYEE